MEEDLTISKNWNCFYQDIKLKVTRETVFFLRASVKVDSENGCAQLWARTENIDGKIGFFENMKDRPISTNHWNIYSIQGIIDKENHKISFGGICRGNGIFCFTNFELLMENIKGELERIEIDNPNFEDTISQLRIPGWKQGIGEKPPVYIKEYSFCSERNRKTDFLKIEGKGIFDIYKYAYKVNSQDVFDLMYSLNSLSINMKNVVQDLSPKDLDYVLRDDVCTIGMSLIHIVAFEAYYQVYTFENRVFNEKEKLKWQIAMDLGKKAQENYKGKSVDYYLNIYDEIRLNTFKLFEMVDQEWMQSSSPTSKFNKHFNWLHVLEHQSYHLGQIVMLKKLIKSE